MLVFALALVLALLVVVVASAVTVALAIAPVVVAVVSALLMVDLGRTCSPFPFLCVFALRATTKGDGSTAASIATSTTNHYYTTRTNKGSDKGGLEGGQKRTRATPMQKPRQRWTKANKNGQGKPFFWL